MKRIYLLPILLLALTIALFVSCSDNFSDEDETYRLIAPVSVNLTQVPYPKLSDYGFFVGNLKDQKPSRNVLPYRPASELFSDYAHKLRFVWMPPGTQATYDGDDNVLDFPVGTVLIKTFYFDNVQPQNKRKIIETRLLIKIAEATPTNSGWETYNYIWNERMKEAYLDTDGNGIFVPITFSENGIEKSLTYKVPAQTECRTCHKHNPTQSANGEITLPIGPKPQNLNFDYDYGDFQMNQLQKWISQGYLENNLPNDIYSTVDWKDTTQPLELRARSYLDMNCAHCHRVGGHCDYVEPKFNFSNTDITQLGLCMEPLFQIDDAPYIINAGDSDHSELIVRIASTDQSIMMPIIGRTTVHEEGVAMLREWIDTMSEHCE